LIVIQEMDNLKYEVTKWIRTWQLKRRMTWQRK
jgi:hypothetical protein